MGVEEELVLNVPEGRVVVAEVVVGLEEEGLLDGLVLDVSEKVVAVV